MNSKWSWIVGIATFASLALAIAFFVATQTISGRDVLVLAIGMIIGASIAAFIATFIFHSDTRKQVNAERAEAALADTRLKVERENKLVELMGLIPTRADRLNDLRQDLAQLDLDMRQASGNALSSSIDARRTAQYDWGSMSNDYASQSEQWMAVRAHKESEISRVGTEIAELEAMSDEEWKQHQVRKRLVGSEDLLRPLTSQRDTN